ncbi:hypothetical protein HYQ45_013406 [Verticillium longisporum]|uniref:Rhodopsin domain-containing protein n=1 Tax=Verticillium longisporum TaxID=100787 RepID=A0A8I3AKY9_VERLO|nr:hypothetical protein HYQ45_013406 [Verticillium longisporum]
MATDPKDLAVLVNASIWSLFALATIALALRLYSRIRIVRLGVQQDDWVLIAGWAIILVASGVMSGLMAIFLHSGSLKKITLARIHHNLQSIALGLTKTSFGLTLLRLMPGGWEAKLIYVVLITMNFQFAVHIIAVWQMICGAPDEGHIGGDKCWTLTQSVTFAFFSAVYSALCDFILALLPWRMTFNLQMKRSERLGIDLALSMGVIAGITGVMKAYYGSKLLQVRHPNYAYNQAVYWIWSMAEPNVTIISASIPVLRGFVRSARVRTESNNNGGGYVKTGDSSNKFYNSVTVTAGRAEAKGDDGDSDRSILGHGPQGRDINGIAWTTTVSVEYEDQSRDNDVKGIAISKDTATEEGIEMEAVTPHPGPTDDPRR